MGMGVFKGWGFLMGSSWSTSMFKGDFNPFMPGGPKINLLFFDFLQLIAKKITPFICILFLPALLAQH